VAESYYSARARRDPAWREQAIAAAADRKRRRRERDPEAFAERHRAEQQRCYDKQAATGLTFAELHRRVGGDRQTLASILKDEIAAGRIDYLGFSRRYRLNGGLPEDVKQALAGLALPEPDDGRPRKALPRRLQPAGELASAFPDITRHSRPIAARGERGR
jgi:hypothetical protein